MRCRVFIHDVFKVLIATNSKKVAICEPLFFVFRGASTKCLVFIGAAVMQEKSSLTTDSL